MNLCFCCVDGGIRGGEKPIRTPEHVNYHRKEFVGCQWVENKGG